MGPNHRKTARVAVVGAGGIGKHHAKWWALEGADVCAFVGTSDESVARTHTVLRDLFGFTGQGYTRLEALLSAEDPDIVDVCSPHARHAGHIRTALAAGCDVLCEKPLVFDPEISAEHMLAEARGLVDLARRMGKRFGICTQYTTLAGAFLRVWRQRRGDSPITHFRAHLEAPAKGRPPDPRRVWVDLSPHLISVLLCLAPGAEVDWGSAATAFEGYAAEATFDILRPPGRPIHCELVARNSVEPPCNVRVFAFNGYPFVVEGETGKDGVYGARIETPDGPLHEGDPMRQLIRAFLHGTPSADGDAALANLNIMLRVLGLSAATLGGV